MTEKRDPVVEAVREDLLRRSQLGIKKYGTTLADNPLTHQQWLQHAYEEALDMALYLKCAIGTAEQAPTAGPTNALTDEQRHNMLRDWVDG